MYRTPPGSKTRSCIHRGNSETWESQLPPYSERPDVRDSGNQTIPRHKEGSTRVILVSSAKVEDTEKDRVE